MCLLITCFFNSLEVPLLPSYRTTNSAGIREIVKHNEAYPAISN